MMTRIKTNDEIKAMRKGGKILRSTLDLVRSQITQNTPASEIDKIVASELKRRGAKPAFLGFEGFPANICVSVNDEIVHGIPASDKIIKKNDLVGLDLGVIYEDMIVDGAITFLVDEEGSSEEAKKLVAATEQSLKDGLSEVRSGCKVGDISSRIQKTLESNQLGVIRDLVGHGVGHHLHEDPNIPNYGVEGKGVELLAGMTLAIEPMASLGGGEIAVDNDGWTIRTKDGSLSAQFEHTILVTENGHEILTTS